MFSRLKLTALGGRISTYLAFVVVGAFVYGFALDNIIPKQREAEPVPAVPATFDVSSPEPSVSVAPLSHSLPLTFQELIGKSEYEAVQLLDEH